MDAFGCVWVCLAIIPLYVIVHECILVEKNRDIIVHGGVGPRPGA